jgi:hypothetical protein
MTEERSDNQRSPVVTNWWLAILLPVGMSALLAVTEGWRYALGLSVVSIATGALIIGVSLLIQRVRK